MGPLERLFDFVQETGDRLKQAWNGASAKPVSFDHFSENERDIITPINDDFRNKAQRGYFDEDVQRDYKRFLHAWGFEKQDVESAVQSMQNIAQSALPGNRAFAKAVQDRYWEETGLNDTRPSALQLFQRDNE